MKRSTQEILELAVFALIALVLGTLLVWGVGWVFTGLGWLLRVVAEFVWMLLRFIIPVAIVAGVVYVVIRLLSQPREATAAPSTVSTSTPTPATPPATMAQPATTVTVTSGSATGSEREAGVDEPAPASLPESENGRDKAGGEADEAITEADPARREAAHDAVGSNAADQNAVDQNAVGQDAAGRDALERPDDHTDELAGETADEGETEEGEAHAEKDHRDDPQRPA